MHSNTPVATNPSPDRDMADIPAKSPSPMTTGKPLSHGSISPAPSISSAPLAQPSSKDVDMDQDASTHNHGHSHSDQRASPTYPGHSPGSGTPTHVPFRDPYHADEQRPYFPPGPPHEQNPRWHQPPSRDGNHPDLRGERHPPSSPYHHDAYYNGAAANWSRASSPPPPSSQGGYKHLSFTRHGSSLQPRSPQSYPSYPDSTNQRPYPGSAPSTMPHSPLEPTPRPHHSSEYQSKRHRLSSDSDGFSDHEGRHRHGQVNETRPHRDREPYRPTSYQYTDPNSSKAHGYGDSPRDYHPMSAYHPTSAPSDSLPALAPRPPRYSMEDDLGPSGTQHAAQYSSAQPQIKKEAASEPEPVKIQSARGTPKGPLPIHVQISLLNSVLKHDPFNCAIRKTTQAWELISKEQGIRARTCSRRFDNIIQASIAGRDRPVGTEEQQATKKKLLEQLFEMMNQPQALKRMQKKRRYRSEDTDKRLLLETIRLNPFAQKVGQVAKAWEDVRDSLNMKVHARQCIRRVNRMVKPYLLRERMYKGNIPEEMREANDDLVKQVILLMRQAGQGNTLDDACSNDEDSASGTSDSEDQEDPDGESKGQDNVQEDDELEDDEDEDMASPNGSDLRSLRKSQDTQPNGTSPPSTPTQSGALSASASVSGPSSTPATPAKRGRPPRNPATSSSSQLNQQPPSPGSTDRTRNQNGDVHMRGVPYEGDDTTDPNGRRPRITGGSEDRIGDDASLTAHGSGQQSPAHSPTTTLVAPHASSHARHYSNGGYSESGDYRRPTKHARTDSRSVREPSSRSDSTRALSPGGSRHTGYTQYSREREEPGYRYGSYPDRGLTVDTHGSGSRRGYHSAPEEMPDTLGHPAPTSQQYRDVMNELHMMRDCLAQLDGQWRSEREKQGSMMEMIEKLQHQMQQQQQQLSQLQHQLRYGYPPHQPPPQQSPHHNQPPQGPPSGVPTSGRYSSYPGDHHPGFNKTLDRHEPEGTQYHVSYSRSDAQYSARDRDPR